MSHPIAVISTGQFSRVPGPQGMEFNEIQKQLISLRQEHRDLDEAIDRLQDSVFVDQLQLGRLKKRKLQLKDQIQWLESKLIPDLDA